MSDNEADDNEEQYSRSDLLQEMIKKQIKSTPINKKLSYGDMKRLVKYIEQPIFKKDGCCLWKGYVTNSNAKNKVQYINFYFQGRKTALHRILYSNFVSLIKEDEFLRFTCPNRGKCCNVNHMEKHKYLTKNEDSEESENEEDDDESTFDDFSISLN